MNEIPLSAHVVICEGVLTREVDGEMVLLNLTGEQYYGLDAVGARMWNVLTQANSVGEAVDVLLAEYDVDRQTLEQDVRALLAELAAHGLVEIHSE